MYFEKLYLARQLVISERAHQIDSKLTNDSENINTEFITGIIDNYDQIIETQDYGFPVRIKKRI